MNGMDTFGVDWGIRGENGEPAPCGPYTNECAYIDALWAWQQGREAAARASFERSAAHDAAMERNAWASMGVYPD